MDAQIVSRLIKKVSSYIPILLRRNIFEVAQNPDYAWHRKPTDMNGFGDIWFFDLQECEVIRLLKIKIYVFFQENSNNCYYHIRTDDDTNRGESIVSFQIIIL